MATPQPFDDKERVRDAVDIVDLVGGELPLRRQGQIFLTHCPWHDDTRPSLQINPQRQSWKCWVCDIGGDVFSWVMRREGVDFRQALVMLAERAGVPLSRSRGGGLGREDDPLSKAAMLKALDWAASQYSKALGEAADAEIAREYLTSRNISPENIRKFRVGFAPKSWSWLLDRSTQFTSGPTLEAAGLAIPSQRSGHRYDRFRGRLMFPICDAQRRCVGFGGRVLPGLTDDEAAKYINSPESALFRKSELLYGIDLARDAISREGLAMVVEGYTDVIMAHQHGLEFAVAVLGTALTESHVRLLRRYADRVALVLDGDAAGQRRTRDVMELFLREQVDVRVLTLPGGADPCDFLEEHGAVELRRLLDGAEDALDYVITQALGGSPVEEDIHAANRALEHVLFQIAAAPAGSSGRAAMRLREQQAISQLARRFRLEEDAVRERLTELRKVRRPSGSKAPGAEAGGAMGAWDRGLGGPPVDSDEPTLAGADAANAALEEAAMDEGFDPATEGAKPIARSRRSAPQRIDRPHALDVESAELFAILTFRPQLAEPALSSIGREDLPDEAARRLWDAYANLLARGDYPDTRSVLLELEDEHLANVLATIDWRSHDHAYRQTLTADQRLAELTDRLARRRQQGRLLDIEQGRLSDEEEALAQLRAWEREERARQQQAASMEGW